MVIFRDFRDLISFLDEPGERSGGSGRGPTSVRRVPHSQGVGSARSAARARRATNVHNANGGGLSGTGSGGSATIPAMPPSALSTLSPSALATTGRELSSADPIAELLSQVLIYLICAVKYGTLIARLIGYLSLTLTLFFLAVRGSALSFKLIKFLPTSTAPDATTISFYTTSPR